MCLSVCLSVSLQDISKTDAATTTKLYTEMFHHESWKLIYFWVSRKVKGEGHEAQHNLAGVGHGAFVSAGFLPSFVLSALLETLWNKLCR